MNTRTMGSSSRLIRRLLIFVWAAFAVGLSWAQVVPVETMVQDTLYRADGKVAHGRLTIRWSGFTTSGGEAIEAGELTVATDANGGIAIPLIPNAGSSPAGSYYKVFMKLDDGTTSEEVWVVPAVPTTTIAAIRAKVVPQAVAAQFVSLNNFNSALATVEASLAAVAPTTLVHLTGTETIVGAKTFTVSPEVPTPADAGAAVDKGYVDQGFAGLAAVASTGNYNDLLNKPTPPNLAAPGAIGSQTPGAVNATGYSVNGTPLASANLSDAASLVKTNQANIFSQPQTVTYTGSDTVAAALLVNAASSSMSANPTFEVALPSSGSQRAMQATNGSDAKAWYSLEYNVGGTGFPGISFGPGGSAARDTSLYRSGANALATAANISAGSFTGPLTGNVTGNLTGTASTATTAAGLTGSPSIAVSGVTVSGNETVSGPVTVGTTTLNPTTGINTPALAVNGTPLASANLSDSANLARNTAVNNFGANLQTADVSRNNVGWFDVRSKGATCLSQVGTSIPYHWTPASGADDTAAFQLAILGLTKPSGIGADIELPTSIKYSSVCGVNPGPYPYATLSITGVNIGTSHTIITTSGTSPNPGASGTFSGLGSPANVLNGLDYQVQSANWTSSSFQISYHSASPSNTTGLTGTLTMDAALTLPAGTLESTIEGKGTAVSTIQDDTCNDTTAGGVGTSYPCPLTTMAPVLQIGNGGTNGAAVSGMGQNTNMKGFLINGAYNASYPDGVLKLFQNNLTTFEDLWVSQSLTSTNSYAIKTSVTANQTFGEMRFTRVAAYCAHTPAVINPNNTGMFLQSPISTVEITDSNIENCNTALDFSGINSTPILHWAGGHMETIGEGAAPTTGGIAFRFRQAQPKVEGADIEAGMTYLDSSTVNGNIDMSASQGWIAPYVDNGIGNKIHMVSSGSPYQQALNLDGSEQYKTQGTMPDPVFINSGTASWTKTGTAANVALATLPLTSPGAKVGQAVQITSTDATSGASLTTPQLLANTDYELVMVLYYNYISGKTAAPVVTVTDNQSSTTLWTSTAVATPCTTSTCVGPSMALPSSAGMWAYSVVRQWIPTQSAVSTWTINLVPGSTYPITVAYFDLNPTGGASATNSMFAGAIGTSGSGTVSCTYTPTTAPSGTSGSGATSYAAYLTDTCSLSGRGNGTLAGGGTSNATITWTPAAPAYPTGAFLHMVVSTDSNAVTPHCLINNSLQVYFPPNQSDVPYNVPLPFWPSSVACHDYYGPSSDASEFQISQFSVVPYYQNGVVPVSTPLDGSFVQAITPDGVQQRGPVTAAPLAFTYAGGDLLCAHGGDTTIASTAITAGTATSLTVGTLLPAFKMPGALVGVTGATPSGLNTSGTSYYPVTSWSSNTLNFASLGATWTSGGTIFLGCQNTSDATSFVNFTNNYYNVPSFTGPTTMSARFQLAYWSTATAPYVEWGLGKSGSANYFTNSSGSQTVGTGASGVSGEVSWDLNAPTSTLVIPTLQSSAFLGAPGADSLTAIPVAYSGGTSLNLSMKYASTGAASVNSSTAPTGGSPSGTGTVTLSGFNDSCTNTTVTGNISSGSWTGATFVVTNTGYGCTAAPTTATCTSGTATCSGTVTFAAGDTVLGGAQGNAMLLETMKITN